MENWPIYLKNLTLDHISPTSRLYIATLPLHPVATVTLPLWPFCNISVSVYNTQQCPVLYNISTVSLQYIYLQYLAIFQCQFTIHFPEYSTVLLHVAVSNQMLMLLAAKLLPVAKDISLYWNMIHFSVLDNVLLQCYIQCTRQ